MWTDTSTSAGTSLTVVHGCEPCSGEIDAAGAVEGAEPTVEVIRAPLVRGRLGGEPMCAGHEITSLFFSGERVGVPVTWLRKIRAERCGDPRTLDLLAAAILALDALGDHLRWPE